MWTRKELKFRGKEAFKANYWRCVAVALLIMIVAGTSAVVGSSSAVGGAAQSTQSVQDTSPGVTEQVTVTADTGDEDLDALLENVLGNNAAALMVLIPVVLFFALVIIAVAISISVLVINPLIVGCERFFSQNSREPAGIGEIAYGFENGYGRVVKTMFLKDVFIFLWTLLFIIPGIIKSYSYRMVPYILAQEPELSGREVIDRSREMMDGNKWKAFVLDLSFILWGLLSAITLGIVGIFYVNPYIEATNAELYYALKGEGQYYSGDMDYDQDNGYTEPDMAL